MAYAQPTADGEDKSGEDAEVQPGDNQQVKRAGALKRRAQIAAEISTVARDHRGEHGRIVMAEGEEPGQRVQGRSVGELHEPVARAGLERVQQAGKAVLCTVAGHDQPFCLRRADDPDSLAEHPCGTIPYARIAVALRRAYRRRYGDDIVASELRHRGIGGSIERKAKTTMDGLQCIAGFGAGEDAQVDGLHLLGDLLIGEGAEGEDAANGAGTQDGASHGDGCALGQVAELCLWSGARLHLCSEAAQKEPGRGERQQGDAGAPADGNNGDKAFEEHRDAKPRRRNPPATDQEDTGSERQRRP